ncbi:hypothetical protein RclHR1_27670001, partial [Rhizophagus clarus]
MRTSHFLRLINIPPFHLAVLSGFLCLRSLILPTNCERIRQSTTAVVSPYSWADLSIMVIPYYKRLEVLPDFSPITSVVALDLPGDSPLGASSTFPFPVPLPSGSHYRYYTDGSLLTWVHRKFRWVGLGIGPLSTRAEAAAIYAALSVSPDDSTITVYTDSQAAIDGLSLCAFFFLFQQSHDGNYWNEFADSLANSAHHSDVAPLLPAAVYTSSHNVRLVFNDIVCESNTRRLFKLY